MPSKGNAAKLPEFGKKKKATSVKARKFKKMKLEKMKRSAKKARKLKELEVSKDMEVDEMPAEKPQMVIQLTKSGIRLVPKDQVQPKKHQKFGVVGRNGKRGKTSRRSFGLG